MARLKWLRPGRKRRGAAGEAVENTENTEKSEKSENTEQRARRKPKAKRGGFTLHDLIHEALEGAGARPSRMFITLFGTVLGIASLVATLGLAQTAAGQIASNFDAVASTRVVVEPSKTDTPDGSERATSSLPWDGPQRVDQLVGAVASSLYVPLPASTKVDAVAVVDPSQPPNASPPVVAVSAGMEKVVDAHILAGRFFDVGHDQRGDRVAVLGETAAQRLGINRVSGSPAIFINGVPYSVIGIIDKVGARENLLNSVIIPANTAHQELGAKSPEALDIRISQGAGPQVAHQAPIALNPNNPDAYKVKAPASAEGLADKVAADVNVLFIAIGAVALVAGGIGIANVTLLSVSERKGEIGLRRALGARRREIAQQFMLESVTTGLLGGLIGAAAGLFVLIAVCEVQKWTPVIDWWVPAGGVLLGALVGLAAGTYPAVKAARLEPVEALRGS